MWFSYVHHISIHFPIALGFLLAFLGVWTMRADDPSGWLLLRVIGGFVWCATTVAVVSGLVAAEEHWTEEGPYVLIHHRNLGVLAWTVVTIAVAGLEHGVRSSERKLMRFGAVMWIAVALAMIGAGHWGGSGLHSDKVPWQNSPPQLNATE